MRLRSVLVYFGSHTHTHEILSKLSYTQQVEELRRSRAIMEKELSRPIQTLAYPVGEPQTFSETTFEALRETGYLTAFSFYSGLNRLGRIEPFNVLRSGVESGNVWIFRLRTALCAATGSYLF